MASADHLRATRFDMDGIGTILCTHGLSGAPPPAAGGSANGASARWPDPPSGPGQQEEQGKLDEIMFGTGLRSPDGVAEFARRAEDLGFDVLGCGEHVMFHVPTANTFVSLAVAAGATTRIRLLSAVVLLPLYPAALAAKMGAALDVASGGRYLFGVGVGGEFPKEFEACGVPVDERGARANEALDVIRRLWTGRDVSYAGRFNTLNDFSIDPMPVQSPPPIWVAGRRDAAMKRAARFGDGWLPYMYTPEQLAGSVAKIRSFGEEAGRDLGGFRFGLYIFTAVHEDGNRAREMAISRLGRQYAQDFSALVGKYALAGTPAEVCGRLREYVDAGASLIMLSSACPDDHLDENIRLIAEEVVPAFRKGTPAGGPPGPSRREVPGGR